MKRRPITATALTKEFDGKPRTTAMSDLSFEIEPGELLVLLGPSGCGKTTTLRCLAGLETPDNGRIEFGDQVVFDSQRRINLSPDQRSIGMVFQSYALWPHMTVRKNIAYPLKARRIDKSVHAERVRDTAALVDCSELLDRYPGQLSGGQQQRVALARGLVAQPDLILLDEPLSNLDARLRDSVRAQLHELHSRLNFSAVFVTHDQSEALALADRIAIMRSGSFTQIGTPQTIFEEPANEYVAAFIGMSNRLHFTHDGGIWTCNNARLCGSIQVESPRPGFVARLRPEDVTITAGHAISGHPAASLPALFVDAQFGGGHYDVIVDIEGTRLSGRAGVGDDNDWIRHARAGDHVTLGLPSDGAAFYDTDDRRVPGARFRPSSTARGDE